MRWLATLVIAFWLMFPACALAAPESEAGGLFSAHAARESGDFQHAAELYRNAGDRPEALFWLGTVLRWSGNLNESRDAFSRLLAIDPDHVDGLLGDGLLALQTEDLGRSEQRLTRALELAPGYRDAQKGLSVVYLKTGRLRPAYALAGQAYTGEERERRLAQMAFSLRWYPTAAAHFKALLDRSPDDPERVIDLGRVFERMGYLDDAVRLYRDALRMHLERADLWVRAGDVHRWLGDYETARVHYVAALEQDRAHPGALLGRAHIELAMDNLGGSPGPDASAQFTPGAASTTSAAGGGGKGFGPETVMLSHTVSAGDTLSHIARRYLGDARRWAELLAANPDMTDPYLIHPGKVVWVPVPRTRLAALTGQPERVNYTVRDGDTLGRIANRFLGTPRAWRAVWRANPAIHNPHRIYPGDHVAVPVRAGTAPAPSLAEYRLETAATRRKGMAARLMAELGSLPTLPMTQVAVIAAVPPQPGEEGDELAVAATRLAVAAERLAAAVEIAERGEADADAGRNGSGNSGPSKANWFTGLPAQTGTPGAAEWLEQHLKADPDSFEGRKLAAQLDYRQLRFAAAEEKYRALIEEYPRDCALCRGWMAARAGGHPVLAAGFEYSVVLDLDGRADSTLSGPANLVRYKTRSLYLDGRQHVTPRLELGATYRVRDNSLVNRSSGGVIYDFDRSDAILSAGFTPRDGDRVSASAGFADFSPNDANSIADKRYTRLAFAWQRQRWDRAFSAGFTQGPFLGRSIPPQQSYQLFRERTLYLEAERQLTPRSHVFGRYALGGYSDGGTLQRISGGARLTLSDHRMEARIARDYQLGRFLDEAVGRDLVFVRVVEATISDHWRRPFPFRFGAQVTTRSYEPVTVVVSGSPQVSPSNRELRAAVWADYVHPALAPLTFGARLDHVRFNKNAFAYDTVNRTGPVLYVQLAPGERPCRFYLLRYEWGMSWDEDPANDHFVHHGLTAEAERTVRGRLTARLSGHYRHVPAFDLEEGRVGGDLIWRF